MCAGGLDRALLTRRRPADTCALPLTVVAIPHGRLLARKLPVPLRCSDFGPFCFPVSSSCFCVAYHLLSRHPLVSHSHSGPSLGVEIGRPSLVAGLCLVEWHMTNKVVRNSSADSREGGGERTAGRREAQHTHRERAQGTARSPISSPGPRRYRCFATMQGTPSR